VTPANLRPEQLMRHRPPALWLGTVVEATAAGLAGDGIDAGPWRGARRLEGAAQTGGLLSSRVAVAPGARP